MSPQPFQFLFSLISLSRSLSDPFVVQEINTITFHYIHESDLGYEHIQDSTDWILYGNWLSFNTNNSQFGFHFHLST